MSNPIIYRMEFKNRNEDLVKINIYDRYRTGGLEPNVYLVSYVVNDNGNGTQTVTFTFFDLLPSSVSIDLGYSLNGVDDWTYQNKGLGSPQNITIPTGEYDYRFRVNFSDAPQYEYNFQNPQIKHLIPDSDPFHLSVINNSEDKFATIRAKQAEFKFQSTQELNMATFMNDPAYFDKYYATVEINNSGRFIFKGYMLLPDLSEPFLAPSNIITLKFTDRLGTLKNAPMVKFDGINPSGYNKVIQYVAWILKKTGMTLPINVISNLWDEDDVNNPGPWWNTIYIHARTFEKEIGVSMDGYAALQAILGEHGFITQEKGEWWIKAIDEYDNHPDYVARYDASGNLIELQEGKYYRKSIGKNEAIWLSKKITTVEPGDEPVKHVKETFRFEPWKELPCNTDFSRGVTIADDSNPLAILYNVDCWILRQGAPGFYSPSESKTYIEKKFNEEKYELEKKLILTSRKQGGVPTFELSSINYITYIESEPIPVNVKDKFDLSIDWKLGGPFLAGPPPNHSYRLMRVVLNGDDGSWWILGEAVIGDGIPIWYNTANWTAFSAKGEVNVNWDSINEEEWQNISFKSAPCPVSGKLYIWLNQILQHNDDVDDLNGNGDINYNNLQFTYHYYLNGAYLKYTAQYNKVTQAGNPDGYNAVHEEEVSLNDSPIKIFKGALFKPTVGILFYNTADADFYTGKTFIVPGDQTAKFYAGRKFKTTLTGSNNRVFTVVSSFYHVIPNNTEVLLEEDTVPELDQAANFFPVTMELAGKFYNRAVFPGGIPDSTYAHSFSYVQAFAVFNQFNRVMRTMRVNAQGLDSSSVDDYDRCDAPGLIHQYQFTDASVHALYKKYMLVSFDQNWNSCEWKGTFKEVFDTVKGKVYGDSWEFKFVS